MSWSTNVSEAWREVNYEKIPEEVIKKAKLRFLDILGITLAASKMKFAEAVFKVARKLGSGGESTVLGYGEKLPIPSAVFANGTFAHGIDFDDTHPPTMTHASVCTIPTALSVGEALKATGKEVIESSVLAAEFTIRVSSVAAMKFYDRGFHITSISAPFGAAFTAGRMMKLKDKEMANAFGLCGSQASGLMEPLWDGSWTKGFHSGWGQHSGVIAAMLAQEGYSGTRKVFEGENGFYNAYAGKGDEFDCSKLVEKVGEEWETLKLCIKPYPC